MLYLKSEINQRRNALSREERYFEDDDNQFV